VYKESKESCRVTIYTESDKWGKGRYKAGACLDPMRTFLELLSWIV